MKIIDCKCPECKKPSGGFIDTEGLVELKCWDCTIKKGESQKGGKV